MLTDFEWILALVTITGSALLTLRLARNRTLEEAKRAEAAERRARAYLSVLQALTRETAPAACSKEERAWALDLARSHGLSKNELHHLEHLLRRAAESPAHAPPELRRMEEGETTDRQGTQSTESRYLFVSFEEELSRARERNLPLTVLTLGVIDSESSGEPPVGSAEERLLRRVAYLVRGQMRGCDTCIRHGSHEFIILLPGISKAEALKVERRLRLALQGATLSPAPGKSTRARIDLGTATCPDDGHTFDQLWALSDERRRRDGASALPPRTDGQARTFVLNEKDLTSN